MSRHASDVLNHVCAQIPADLLFPDPRGRRGVLSKAEDSTDDQPFLSAKAQKKVTLVEKEKLSHNVTRFRFSLDAPDRLLGLPTGKHMLIRKSHKNKEGEEEMVMRAYTPTTANETRGYFELVVKIYWANEVERFPDGGKFSQVRSPTRRVPARAPCAQLVTRCCAQAACMMRWH